MKNEKKCKVLLLPTNEKANLLLTGRNDLYYSSKLSDFSLKEDIDTFQHLYFLSDEEIKVGDWIYDEDNGVVKIEHKYQLSNINVFRKDCKKIIATTDKSLSEQIMYYPNGAIIGGIESYKLLPQTSQSFIEKFVEEYNKGNVITEVLVEYEDKVAMDGHTIIGSELKISKDNTITIRKVKDSWNRDEVRELLITAYSKGRTNRLLRDFNEWLKENL